MSRFCYISTNFRSHLSDNKLLYSKFKKSENHKTFHVTMLVLLWTELLLNSALSLESLLKQDFVF